MASFENSVVVAKNLNFDMNSPKPHLGIVNAAGKIPIGTGNSFPTPEILAGSLTSPDSSITFGYSSPNITAIVNTAVLTDLHTARFIVSVGGSSNGANYTSIATALTAAVAAGGHQTIFIQPGTYTENLTLRANINLTAYACDSETPNVTIVGKATATSAGTCTLSGINLQTNGDYVLELTGANSPQIRLIDCYLNLTNANGIHITGTGASVIMYRCNGDCAANTYFIATAGGVKAYYCVLGSGNNTTVNSTFANSDLELDYTYFACPITTSGTGSVGFFKAQIICTNTTALTHGGSGNSLAMETRFESGSASAISIGSTLSVIHSSVFSTNANAITGAGTLLYGMIVFYGSGASSTVNTVTQTALAILI